MLTFFIVEERAENAFTYNTPTIMFTLHTVKLTNVPTTAQALETIVAIIALLDLQSITLSSIGRRSS